MEITLPYEKYQSTGDDNRVELEGSFGNITLCRERGLTSVITGVHLKISRPVTLQIRFEAPEVSLRYWLKGDWDGKKGSYQMVYQPGGKWTIHMEPGEYSLICAAAGTVLLNRLSLQYNSIREVLSYLEERHISVQRQYASRIDARVKMLLHQLGTCELTGVSRELFMEARMNDLMLQYLNYISSHQMDFCTKYHFTPADLDGIYQAKDMHDLTIDAPPSIKTLASTVNLHHRKLGDGLGLLFGKGIRQLRAGMRMEKAAELLHNTDKSIREISVELGFDSYCAFCRAFRLYFGCSALKFRR